jgi:hypothetical protein
VSFGIDAGLMLAPDEMTAVVLTVTPEEQRERILTRTNPRYGLERG